MGELIENTRIFALPDESFLYPFTMQYTYDTWNRMTNMTYPDGEVVSYSYDLGGQLKSMTTNDMQGNAAYIADIQYDKFGNRTQISYGNGSQTNYSYDMLQRLSNLQTMGNNLLLQDIDYSYDNASNITSITNNAGSVYGLGGNYSNGYNYDNLYRLSFATGSFNNQWLYDLSMNYSPNGKILNKDLSAPSIGKVYYNYYFYNGNTPNTVSSVSDGYNTDQFTWDTKGNMTVHHSATTGTRRHCWDEENRMMAVGDQMQETHYLYNTQGERVYKLTGEYQQMNVSGQWYQYMMFNNPTLYAFPYLVVTPRNYTKHYYAGDERITSKLRESYALPISLPPNEEQEISVNQKNRLVRIHFECLTGNFDLNYAMDKLWYIFDNPSSLQENYYYHTDHLGSSSWITDKYGSPIQFLHYLPFGETAIDQRATRWNAPYTFSGKEKDEETGYSYFGARYYNSDLSIWLSVDPLAGKYPSSSPYVYCLNNPIKLIDPDGMKVVIPGEEDQAFINNLIDENSKDYSKGFHDLYKKLDESDHTYTFESWAYDPSRGEDGAFEVIDENNSSIRFTKDDNPQTKDAFNGASKYRVLFEEIHHASQFDKTGKVNRTCINEAFAWKFSATAPGTKYSYYDSKTITFKNTFMSRLKNSSIAEIATGFKLGMPPTNDYSGFSGPGFYHDFKLGTKSEIQLIFPTSKTGFK